MRCENLLRTALGAVKSKAAALHYESWVAELYAAGADIGDYGHSCKLFPDMIAVACEHIDQQTSKFLSSASKYKIETAEKSTNFKINNKISLIMTVADAKRQEIPT